jgi:hypothetical protein
LRIQKDQNQNFEREFEICVRHSPSKWMELDGIGWNWMELDGIGWNWMELDGIG